MAIPGRLVHFLLLTFLGTCFDLSAAAPQAGTVVSWGHQVLPPGYSHTRYIAVTATPPQGLADVVAIAAGNFDSLAVKCDGTVVGWGYNSFGVTNIPPDLANVAAVAVGQGFAAALRRDGTVTVWGVGFVAEYIEGWTGVMAISAGFHECYALTRDGFIFNSNDDIHSNELVDMESSTDRYLAITTRGSHNVAIRRDGIVKDWNYPTPGLDNITSVSAGFQSMNAGVRPDGTVHFWGDPFYKALFVTNLLSNVVSLTKFGYLNGALLQDGRVASWSEGEDRSFFFIHGKATSLLLRAATRLYGP